MLLVLYSELSICVTIAILWLRCIMFCEQLIIKIYFPMFLFGLQLKNAYAVAKLRKTGYSKQKFYKEAFDLYKEVCSIPPPPPGEHGHFLLL